VSRNFEVGSK